MKGWINGIIVPPLDDPMCTKKDENITQYQQFDCPKPKSVIHYLTLLEEKKGLSNYL